MRKLLFLASAVVLVDTSFYAAITPLLPDLTEEYGLSKTGAGILAAAYPIGTFFGGLPGGWMAARVGVRPTVLTGLALMVLASIAFAFAPSVLMLDIARFVQGVGGAASWAGAMGWLAGAAPRDKRGQMIGTAMGAAIAGALLGPVIGVAADLAGFELVFCTVAGVGVGLMIWTLRTPAAKPVGDGSLRGLIGALGDGRVRTGLAPGDRSRPAVRHAERARTAADGRTRRDDASRSAPSGSSPRPSRPSSARSPAASPTAAGRWRRCWAACSAARSPSRCCRGRPTR